MAVLVAPWLGLLLGLGFAWFSTETLSRSEHSALASPALLLASAFGLTYPRARDGVFFGLCTRLVLRLPHR